MKKNDKRIDRVYSFFNAIRGNNTPNEYQSVLAVLKKVMVLIHFQRKKDLLISIELYRDLMNLVGLTF